MGELSWGKRAVEVRVREGVGTLRSITQEMAVAALKELERELALRKNVYHRLIRDGKLTPEAARKQIESLRFGLLIVKDWLGSRGMLSAARRLIEVGEKSERDCEECRSCPGYVCDECNEAFWDAYVALKAQWGVK